jgi:hypothetical protein
VETEPEIKTVYVEKPVEVVKEVIKDVPTKPVAEIVNESSSTIGGRGPLYQFRTKKSEDDDKNRSIGQD